MKKKIIYLLLEISKRELDARVLFGLKALENNFEVAIAKKSRLFEKLDIIKPGIIFLKSFGINYERFLKKIKDNGHVLSGIDEEGLQVAYKSWIVGKRFSKKVLNDLNLFFSWSDFTKKIYDEFVIKNKNKKLKIVSSGHPKMDILGKKTIKFYQNEALKIKKKYKKFILIATLFPRFNRPGININKQENFYKEIYKGKKDLFSKKNIDKIFHQKQNFFEYEKLYSYLNRNLKKINFIIRPHPGEDSKFYSEKIEKQNYSNIIISNSNESIIPYIIASETLISCNCTTSIESYMLGKPSINYIPWKDKNSEFKLPRLLSINVRKLTDLKELIVSKSYKKKNIIDPINIIKGKKYLENLKKIDSSQIIINNLEKLNVNSENRDNINQNLINYLFFYLKTKIKTVFSIILKRNSIGYQVEANKRKNFNKKEVQRKVNELSKILYPKNKYLVKEKYYGIYYIEKI